MYVDQSVRVSEDANRNFDISLDLRKYVKAIQYSLSGNLVWSIYCPRYHPEASCNDDRHSMMEKMTASQTLARTSIKM